MKIAYIVYQKINIDEADRKGNATEFQLHNDTYEQASLSEKLFHLKEDIQGLLSRIEENIDLK